MLKSQTHNSLPDSTSRLTGTVKQPRNARTVDKVKSDTRGFTSSGLSPSITPKFFCAVVISDLKIISAFRARARLAVRQALADVCDCTNP
ncbi:MAG TPA: hypothetical protein VGI03_07055 [Verrucomicrobiae bacterium]